MQTEQEKVLNAAMKTGNWAQRNPLALAFVIMIASIGGNWVTVKGRIADKDRQIDDMRLQIKSQAREIKEWQLIVVPQLRKIEPIILETKEKLDSLIQK